MFGKLGKASHSRDWKEEVRGWVWKKFCNSTRRGRAEEGIGT